MRPTFLHVELCDLSEVRVASRLIILHGDEGNPDRLIRPTFQELRHRVAALGPDPDTLLHIGIPEIADGQLVSYEVCVECPLPEAGTRLLPGGIYAVLTVEKRPEKIGPAIRSLRGDYLPGHGLIPDEDRPTYEIYYQDTLEYCVPIR